MYNILMVDVSKLDEFLKATKSPSPVNAIIFSGEAKELEQLQTALAHNGYHEVHEMSDLLDRLDLDTRLALYTKYMQGNELSDLISQINNSSISMFDKKTRQKHEIDNIKASVLFIFEKEQIKELQKQGFKLLEDIGICFQF
jgi:hypothetical protein